MNFKKYSIPINCEFQKISKSKFSISIFAILLIIIFYFNFFIGFSLIKQTNVQKIQVFYIAKTILISIMIIFLVTSFILKIFYFDIKSGTHKLLLRSGYNPKQIFFIKLTSILLLSLFIVIFYILNSIIFYVAFQNKNEFLTNKFYLGDLFWISLLPLLTIFVVSFLLFFISGKNAGSISSVVMIAIFILSLIVPMSLRISASANDKKSITGAYKLSGTMSGSTLYTEDSLQQELLKYSYQEKIFKSLSINNDNDIAEFKNEVINSISTQNFDIDSFLTNFKKTSYYSDFISNNKIEKISKEIYGSDYININLGSYSIPDSTYQEMSLVFSKMNTTISKILSSSFDNWIIKTQLGHQYDFLVDNNYVKINNITSKINISDLVAWTYFYNIGNSIIPFEQGVTKEVAEKNNDLYSRVSKMSNLNLELNPLSQLNSFIFGFDSTNNDFRARFDTSSLAVWFVKNATVQGNITYKEKSPGLYVISSTNIKNKNKVPRMFVSWMIILLILIILNVFKFKKYIKF